MDYDERSCRAREILTRIGDKWSVHVIHLLGTADGPRRFMDLRRNVLGISQRMLTVTLRGLERDGLVRRTVYPVVPPRVDYELTPLGLTLLKTICTLMSWSLEHVEDIDRARAEYDRRRAREGDDGHDVADPHGASEQRELGGADAVTDGSARARR